MVRKRGVARKSFSHRRVRRVQKYDHHVLPRRFKIYLPRMSDALEEELPPCVLCEEPTMALLQSLGVPTEEWQYYLGFMKRMIELYLTFTSETLQKEKDSLIAEYVLRGKDKDVLEQVQAVSEVCAGIVVSCTEVKACLEGDFSSWALQWTTALYAHITRMSISTSANNILLMDDLGSVFRIIRLSDGTLLSSVTGPLAMTNWVNTQIQSVLGTYMLQIYQSGGGNMMLQIYKNGTLQQEIDLTTVAGFNYDVFNTSAAISQNGEYVLVSCPDGMALFKGS